MIGDAITYSYDPDGPELRHMRRRVTGRWRRVTEIFAIAIMLVFLYFTVRLVLRESGNVLGGLHPAMLDLAPLVFWSGIVLGLAAAWLCTLLVERLFQAIHDVETEDGQIYRSGPVSVTLTQEGIRSEARHSAENIAWRAVREVIDTPQGLALRLSCDSFVPVLDAALPKGTGRERLRHRVEAWRAA